jgi:hypothetical protein
MFGIFKKKKATKNIKKDEAEHTDVGGFKSPTWYPIGEGNPFDESILDIRCVTLNLVSTTKDQSIAENFNISRSDDGKQYIDQDIPDGKSFTSNIRYPHNGEELEGVVFKAESMDVKWDIYAYGEWFYFVRSWTSDLVYKVHYQNTGSELVLDSIVTSLEAEDNSTVHEQNIHSLMLTHVFGRVWPYNIPKGFESDSEQAIALYLFSQFGCKATIATSANTLEIKNLGVER